MGEQVILAFIAIAIGVGAGILLFVPFVAVSYRRRGGLSFGRALLWFAALVYFWAIWTYTLLPLPDPDSIRCVGMITDPTEIVRDLQKAFSEPGNPLRHPALLQIVFNVLLFVPLGVFLRVLGARGIILALVVGFGLSLLIETTQLTGVWGLYPCAYRFFDVGDLMTNTTGAVLGSIFGLVVPRAKRGMAARADADEPRPVTRGRRAVAMVCDALAYGFVMYGAGIVTQLWFEYVVREREVVLEGRLAEVVGIATASGLWLLVVLLTGRSVGDIAVQLRYAGARMPVPVARVLRWGAGIGGIGALPLLGDVFDWISSSLILASVVLLFTTRLGRGLPGLVTGQELVDARADAAAGRRV